MGALRSAERAARPPYCADTSAAIFPPPLLPAPSPRECAQHAPGSQLSPPLSLMNHVLPKALIVWSERVGMRRGPGAWIVEFSARPGTASSDATRGAGPFCPNARPAQILAAPRNEARRGRIVEKCARRKEWRKDAKEVPAGDRRRVERHDEAACLPGARVKRREGKGETPSTHRSPFHGPFNSDTGRPLPAPLLRTPITP
jgi:hypothetical protein